MDATNAYAAISARFKYFLNMETEQRGFPGSDQVCLTWEMPEENCGDDKNSADSCRWIGVLVRGNSWFKDLIEDMEMVVKWDFRNTTVKLRFAPANVSNLCPLLGEPSLFLWNGGSAMLAARSLQVGNFKASLTSSSSRKVRVRLLESGVTDVEWEFVLEERIPSHPTTSFEERFGSSLVQLVLQVKPASAHGVLCEDITKLLDEHEDPSTDLSVRDTRLVQLYLRELPARCIDGGLFVLKCAGSRGQIYVMKSTLAERSPIFAALFRLPESDEVRQKCHVVPNSTPEGLAAFVVYCEHFVIPNMDKHYLELAKLAHRYQVQPLLASCELYMMDRISLIYYTGIMEFGFTDLEDEFPELLEIFRAASLFQLPLVLVLSHYVVLDLERTIVHLPELFPLWQSFLADNPDFWLKRHTAMNKISEKVVRKRKREENLDETA